MYRYPIDIVVAIEKMLKEFKTPHLLENPQVETFFGYVNDKGEKFYYDNKPSDKYLNTEIKYEDYQKSIFLTDYHNNKYVIRIDCLDDVKEVK